MAGETGTGEVVLTRPHDGVPPNSIHSDNDIPPEGSGVRADIETAMKELGVSLDDEGGEREPDETATGEEPGGEEQEAQGNDAQPPDEGGGEEPRETREEPAKEPAEPAEPTGLEPPEAWPDDQKATFAELPEPQRKFMLERFKDMDAAHTRRSQAIKPIMDAANKWRPYLQSRQMSPGQAFDYLIGAEHQLSTGTQEQKQEAFLGLMDAYGVDPLELAATAEEKGGQEETEVDPGMRKLLEPVTQSVQDLHRRMDAREAQGTQEQQMADLGAFADAKDADGNLLHPYFDELVDDMLLQAQARVAAGQTVTYEELYEAAQWTNPDVRKRLLDAQSVESRKAAGQQHATQRREQVQNAKTAGTKVNGQPGGETQEQPRDSVHEEIMYQARKAGWKV